MGSCPCSCASDGRVKQYWLYLVYKLLKKRCVYVASSKCFFWKIACVHLGSDNLRLLPRMTESILREEIRRDNNKVRSPELVVISVMF